MSSSGKSVSLVSVFNARRRTPGFPYYRFIRRSDGEWWSSNNPIIQCVNVPHVHFDPAFFCHVFYFLELWKVDVWLKAICGRLASWSWLLVSRDQPKKVRQGHSSLSNALSPPPNICFLVLFCFFLISIALLGLPAKVAKPVKFLRGNLTFLSEINEIWAPTGDRKTYILLLQ